MDDRDQPNTLFLKQQYSQSTFQLLNNLGYDNHQNIDDCEIISEWLDRCYLDPTGNDFDENELVDFIVRYKEGVKIGEQVWMVKNLDVETFKDGTPIKRVHDWEEWMTAFHEKTPVWYYYDNNHINGKLFGKLYNYHAIKSPLGLAPEGWRIPSESDWEKLEYELGGGEKAGKKIKMKGFWESDDENFSVGTNESGFSALPGGVFSHYDRDYKPFKIGFGGAFACLDGWDRVVTSDWPSTQRLSIFSRVEGRSVRCIRET